MSDALFWAVVVAIGIATFLIRFSFIALASEPEAGDGQVGSLWQRALRFVPVVVLPALVAPALAFQSGDLALTWQNPRLIAGLVAAFVAWRSRNVLATLGVGMALLWALQAAMG